MAWERWRGGRVWVAQDGSRTYYGLVAGRMVSTRRHTEAEAVDEINRLTLLAGGEGHPLCDWLIAEYVLDCAKRGINRQSCNEKRRHLTQWQTRVKWRPVTLKVLNGVVPSMTGARNKVATIKAYYTWLRQRGRVTRDEDPTLDLAKPHAPPSDWDRLVPVESHRKAVEELDARWGDLLVVLMGTG
jgi:hypothetical protein